MRWKMVISAVCVLAFVNAESVLSQGVVQQIGMNGSVDFTQRTITATGIGVSGGMGGRAGVKRAAKMDAWRNLIEIINGVALTSETTVENQMLSSDVVKSRVVGIAKNYRMVGEPRYYDDGSIEVTIEMSLDGPFLEAILPEGMGRGHPLSSAVIGVAYTGLIVDATGLGARPAIAPKILNEDGQEVYGSSFVSREWAIKYGMVGYEKDIKAATNNDRVTDKPLIAEALRVTGTNMSDIVISNEDAQTLHSMEENLNFLQKCRVLIILD
ncbi:hypothetical protein CEE37_03415 [candidate division LCP-89 bacterium B3_LCP]|uniref:Flagellar biosynthesis protein FlgA n=1 Tax=candidate division LCP-89 bacterium B3_LCP TaxID=2012998 RepID=A0A532V3A8_UNCL8|nr:MAG: hypothetical protein CEE37_03415 [candidate division LCP-89 bacterium B3_LCP]